MSVYNKHSIYVVVFEEQILVLLSRLHSKDNHLKGKEQILLRGDVLDGCFVIFSQLTVRRGKFRSKTQL